MVAGRFVQLQNQHRELATERVERRIARALPPGCRRGRREGGGMVWHYGAAAAALLCGTPKGV
jgi:hypothetical protein